MKPTFFYVIIQKASNHTILNVILQIPDVIMLSWMKHIEGVEFLSLDSCKQFHLRIQIAKVTKCQLQCLTRQPRLQRIKQHGSLTY